jgi:hypothetical protein
MNLVLDASGRPPLVGVDGSFLAQRLNSRSLGFTAQTFAWSCSTGARAALSLYRLGSVSLIREDGFGRSTVSGR